MATSKGRDLGQDLRFGEVVDQLATGYKSIGQMVYAVLREAIVSGAFAPGEWLRQESIAEAIGVSRIPVRTALTQLGSEGLVTFHLHRGARVRTVSPEQIDEIYQLRWVLESHALGVSMARMSPERLARLRELADLLDTENEGVELVEIRKQFYREAYDATSNPLLIEMIEQVRGRVGRYMLSFRVHGHMDRQHSILVDHMERGDLVAARAWLRPHLEGVRAGIHALAAGADQHDAADAANATYPEDEANGESRVATALRSIAGSTPR